MRFGGRGAGGGDGAAVRFLSWFLSACASTADILGGSIDEDAPDDPPPSASAGVAGEHDAVEGVCTGIVDTSSKGEAHVTPGASVEDEP